MLNKPIEVHTISKYHDRDEYYSDEKVAKQLAKNVMTKRLKYGIDIH